MKQLVFDEQFHKVMDEPITYWHNFEDIPDIIKKYIRETSKAYSLCDKQGNYYCSLCFNKLDDNFYCHHCAIKYLDGHNQNNTLYIYKGLNDLRNFRTHAEYWFFDIKDQDILLYIVDEEIYFDNPLTIKPFKTSNFIIKEVWYITGESMTELLNSRHYSYQELELKLNYEADDPSLFLDFTDTGNMRHLYLDNIKDLKKTIYYYSLLWKVSDYLPNIPITLVNLVYAPLHCPQFEYLIKKKLYRLAFDNVLELKYDADSKELLDDKKDYLNFIRENDLGYMDFMALKKCRIKDLELIKFISNNYWEIEDILEVTKIDLGKLKEYFDKNALSYEYLSEYGDYLKLASKQGLDVKDKKILFPINFSEQHDALYRQEVMRQDPMINERINSFSKILDLNSYQDDQYIIVPAKSIDDLVKESSMQQNCVRTYYDRYSQKETQIYFMRKKEKPFESFVTIEVQNGRIRQARTKYNQLPNAEIMAILSKWEKQLIPIQND